MNWWWFVIDLAAAAAGCGLAVVVSRRWLVRMLPVDATTAERRHACCRSALIAGSTSLVPLAAGLIVIMWHEPGDGVADFFVAAVGFTLAAWFAGQRRVRGSGGREPSPTGRD